MIKTPCKYGWLVLSAMVAWNFTILLGTSYIVFWLGYSGWWFLLALVLMVYVRHTQDKGCEPECRNENG